jgi:hypothetical protein
MTSDKRDELEEMAAALLRASSQASTRADSSQNTSVDQGAATVDSDPAKSESTGATPAAEVELQNEATTTNQPVSRLAGLDLDTAIHLRWVLRDIKAKRTNLSPVSPDDLRTLIEMGLVAMQDDVPQLTDEGHRTLDWN